MADRHEFQIVKRHSDSVLQDDIKPAEEIVNQLPNTNILIDSWKRAEVEDKFIRFMTIFQTEAEELKFIKEGKYKVYTSAVNKKHLELHYGVSCDRIVAVEPKTRQEIYDENAGYSFKVTAIDSHYCAGSCMLFFQGPFGNILYTGFLSSKLCDLVEDPILKHFVQKKLITEVYIDNSCAAKHCIFPSRADITETAVLLIEEHPHHKIIIAGDEFGSGEILNDIAVALDENIGVSESMYKKLAVWMQHPPLKFVPRQDYCRIIVEDQLSSLERCKKRSTEKELCLVILLTAQFIFTERYTLQLNSNLFILPYSPHASHCYLMYFLHALKPHAIKPIILSESKSTIIPPNIMNMRYTNRDCLVLNNSGFNSESSNSLNAKNESSNTHEFSARTLSIFKWSSDGHTNWNSESGLETFPASSEMSATPIKIDPHDVRDHPSLGIFPTSDPNDIVIEPPAQRSQCNAINNDPGFILPHSNLPLSQEFHLENYIFLDSNNDASSAFGSNALENEHAQAQFKEGGHCEINTSEKCYTSPTITDERNELVEFPLQIVKEPSVEENQLTTVLYHTLLITETAFWQKTNLTCDSWKDLEGMLFL